MRLLASSVAGLAGIILLMVGCPFLAVAAGIYYFTDYAVRDWPVVSGTVTGLVQSQSYDSDTGSSTTVYCPTVACKVEDGPNYEVDVHDCSAPAAYRSGDSIELYVNPQRPEEVRIKGGTSQTVTRVLLLIFGVLGLLMSGLGGILIAGALIGAFRRR
jgi:hypothetical protein